MTVVVAFVDTGVLLEILDVPGKAQDAEYYQLEYDERRAEGQRFILPTAAIIETGNHVNQAGGPNVDKRAVAERFDSLVRDVLMGVDRWAVAGTEWDEEFIGRVMDGGPTGVSFLDHATNGAFGTGDLSILAERQLFLDRSSFFPAQVEVWTTETEMLAWV